MVSGRREFTQTLPTAIHRHHTFIGINCSEIFNSVKKTKKILNINELINLTFKVVFIKCSQTFGPDATDIGTQTFGEPVDFTNFNGGGENSAKSDDIALFVSTKKFPEGTTFDQLKNPLKNEPYHYDAHGLNGIPANHKLSPSLKTAPDFHHQSPNLKDFASKSPSLKVEPARDLKESWPKKVGPSIPIRTHRTANFANHAPILSAAPSFNQRAPPTFTASNPKPIAAKQSFGCNLK